MKLPVLLLAGSLAGNAVLLGTLAVRPALAPPAMREFFVGLGLSSEHASAPRKSAAATPAAKPPALDTWKALQTDDLKTFVANLRAAGFPTSVIRAMVGIRISAQFRDRVKELMGTQGVAEYWKPDAMNGLNSSKFFEAYNQIFRDRAKVMREVLGSDYFANSPGEVTAAQRRQYGNLPKAKIDLVQQINDDYAEMTAQIRAAMQGITLPEDREKMALLEREKRADLAAVLTPEELDDYMMHSSNVTSRLRVPLSIMDASEAEFKALFKIFDKYQADLNPTAGGGVTYFSQDMMQRRRDAEKAVNDQAIAALGPERGAEFARANNSEFQQLYRLVQRDGLPVDAAVRAYNLRDTTAQESVRIVDAKDMSPADKRAALTTLAQATRAQLVGALGVESGNAYAKSANWLNAIERGSSVTFGPSNSASYRSVPSGNPPTR